MKLRSRTRPTRDPAGQPDRRPRFAIGHIAVSAADVGRIARFYESIGMRKVVRMPGIAIIELRGGTHLAITRGEPGACTLDLMVDDIDETREVLVAAGAEPGSIRREGPHRVFGATDPEGNRLIVNFSHVVGPV